MGAGEEWKVHQQKLRVVYLPPEGQTVEEEEEDHADEPLPPSRRIGAEVRSHTGFAAAFDVNYASRTRGYSLLPRYPHLPPHRDR